VFQGVERPCAHNLCLCPAQNATLAMVGKRCFKRTPGPASSFSASWSPQFATWARSRTQCFKGSPVTANSFSASWPSQNAIWAMSRKLY
jgi:hypothetical protein